MNATEFMDIISCSIKPGNTEKTYNRSWENCVVKCMDNNECEKYFEVGIEYMCYQDGLKGNNGDKYIIVFDIENEKRYVPRKQFVRA